MRLGFDIDGVLANWNASFERRLAAVTGRNLVPVNYRQDVWHWPQALGYTDAEVSATWDNVVADPFFWQNLAPYKDTPNAMVAILDRYVVGDYIYFITSRPGVLAKQQTENWLQARFKGHTFRTVTPTVLITSHKGLAARTLGLDAYVDDMLQNVLDVATTGTRSFLFNQPWNADANLENTGVTRVNSVAEMLAQL